MKLKSDQNKHKQGAALITVLALIVLLSLLVVSLVSLSQSRLTSSTLKETVVNLDSLRDSSINLAIGQLRNATTQEGKIWSSQPGAIRTFDVDGGQPSKIFKLYSDDQMVEDHTSSNANLENDLVSDWASNPNLYVDLNSPKVNTQGEAAYPIVDPRAFNSSSPDTNPEGFSFDKNVISGVTDETLPMPVRWIYVLRDGSIGTLDSSGEFDPYPGQKAASENNPITGRFAFWVDDESQKININTASEAIPWDTPRCFTPEDINYANNQPVLNEVQRFSGHPATTCLSSVFYPGEYLDPDRDQTKLRQIYDIAPRVHYDGGILAGNSTRVTNDPDRLYTSVDELLFNNERSNQFTGEINTIPLEQRRFFLTANSNSPEITPEGKPKLALWPLHYQENQGDKFTPYDRVIRFTSTLGEQPYYHQRSITTSQFGDWRSNTVGATVATQNGRVLEYLGRSLGYDFGTSSASTTQTTPGYERNFFDKYGDRNMSYNVYQLIDYLRGINMLDDTKIDSTGDGSLDSRVTPWTPAIRNGGDFYRIGTVNSMYTGTSFMNLTANAEKMAREFAYQGHASRGPWTLGRRYALSEVALVFLAVVENRGGTINPPSMTAYANSIKLPVDTMAIHIAAIAEMSSPGAGYPNMVPINIFRAWNANQITINGDSPRRLFDSAPEDDEVEFSSGSLDFGLPTSPYPTTKYFPMWKGSGLGGVADYRLMSSGSRNLSKINRVPVPETSSLGNTRGVGTDSDNFAPFLYFVKLDSDKMNLRIGTGFDFGQQHNGISSGTGSPFLQNNQVAEADIPIPDIPTDTDLQGNWKDRLKTFFTKVQTDPDADLLHRNDVIRSFACSHGDIRLTVTGGHIGWSRGDADKEKFMAPLPNWNSNDRHVHTLYKNGKPLVLNAAEPSDLEPLLPLNYADEVMPDLGFSPTKVTYSRNVHSTGFYKSTAPDALERRPEAAADPLYPYSINPAITRDWDTGPGILRDGGYSNVPDYGTHPSSVFEPYFTDRFDYSIGIASGSTTGPEIMKPNHLMPSAGMFGSIPTMAKSLVPWTTFLFRPELNAPHIGSSGRDWGSAGSHALGTSNRSMPADHMLMEYFWMPVVQPYAISEPFSTAGKVGMNYRMAPFSHIHRATALHAVLKSERMLTIPGSAASTYKTNRSGGQGWRNPIDADMTLLQWEDRFDDGNYFRTPSEVCEMFLVPRNKGISGSSGSAIRTSMRGFWAQHQLTGDNVIERPYTNIYPRLTTKSNAYRVHFLVQTIKKAPASDPGKMDPDFDIISGEHQGDALIERYVDPNDAELENNDYAFLTNSDAKALDNLYQYRIRNIRRFSN